MMMNLNNKRHKDREKIRENIETTLNSFWTNVKTINERSKSSKSGTEILRHFIFLEKSMAFLAMDWGINVTLEIENGELLSYKTSLAAGGTFCTIDALYLRICEYTGLDFNKISNKDFINISLLGVVLNDSKPKLYSKLDAIDGKFKDWVWLYEDNGKVVLVNPKEKVFKVEEQEYFESSYFIVE